MTTVLALSIAGFAWLVAGTVLWGMFVALGFRFETRREALSVPRAGRVSHQRLPSATEVVRT